MNIDEAIHFKQSGFSDHFITKGDTDKAESLVDGITGTVEEWEELVACYKGALMEMKTRLNILNEQFALCSDQNPIETIKARMKKPESIYEKLQRLNVPLTVSSIEKNIEDVAGIRVICSFMSDIYLIANCLKKQDDLKIILEKDYIKDPKPNGYRSLHIIVEVPIFLRQGKKNVQVEIQLRTIAMDFWASLEHKIRYKKNIPDSVVTKLGMDLKSTAELANLLDERMQEVRNDMRKSFDWYTE